MMESTDPAEYAAFADQLPALSPEFVQLREAVIAIQIPWMEEFAAQYPNLASRARVIHTAEDSPAQTPMRPISGASFPCIPLRSCTVTADGWYPCTSPVKISRA